jgi:hypothetical protein
VGLWKTVRREVAGAWRSARYDVDPHVGHHRAAKLQRAETADNVNREIVWQRRPSPGRHHHQSPDLPWAGRWPATQEQPTKQPRNRPATQEQPTKQATKQPANRPTPQAPPTRKPRRPAVAATGVALLVAGGAAGTYLAVAGSLAGVNANANASDPIAAPAATPNESTTQASTPKAPPQRTHRRAAAAPAKPADIRPVVPPPPTAAPTPTQSIEATPTPSPTDTPTPSPSVSPTTTDEADAQFTGGHHWRHRGQTRDGR